MTNYFDNLLPDNDQVRSRIQQRFGMSSLSPFDLLTEIGRDCVGVLQLLLDGEAPGNIKQIETDAVSEDDMAELPAGFPERVESQYWRDLGS